MNAINIYNYVVWAEFRINILDALNIVRLFRKNQPIPENYRIFPCENRQTAKELRDVLS